MNKHNSKQIICCDDEQRSSSIPQPCETSEIIKYEIPSCLVHIMSTCCFTRLQAENLISIQGATIPVIWWVFDFHLFQHYSGSVPDIICQQDWIIQCAVVVVDQCCRSDHRLQLFCNEHVTWIDKDMRWTYFRYRPNTGQAFSCNPIATNANEYRVSILS